MTLILKSESEHKNCMNQSYWISPPSRDSSDKMANKWLMRGDILQQWLSPKASVTLFFLSIYCTLSLCKAAAETVNYTKAGWERVVTLANEGEMQWHFISTLASPFPLLTFLCGLTVTWSSPLICVLWWLQTHTQIHTLLIYLQGMAIFFIQHRADICSQKYRVNKSHPKTVHWLLKTV